MMMVQVNEMVMTILMKMVEPKYTLAYKNILIKCPNMSESGKMKNDTLPIKNILVKCPNFNEIGEI